MRDLVRRFSLELRTPFAYLRELTDEFRTVSDHHKGGNRETKNGGNIPAVSPGTKFDSAPILLEGLDHTRTSFSP